MDKLNRGSDKLWEQSFLIIYKEELSKFVHFQTVVI